MRRYQAERNGGKRKNRCCGARRKNEEKTQKYAGERKKRRADVERPPAFFARGNLRLFYGLVAVVSRGSGGGVAARMRPFFRGGETRIQAE